MPAVLNSNSATNQIEEFLFAAFHIPNPFQTNSQIRYIVNNQSGIPVSSVIAEVSIIEELIDFDLNMLGFD